MDDKIKPLPYRRRPCNLNSNVAFGLRVWGRWTKNETLTQRICMELCATLKFGAWGFI